MRKYKFVCMADDFSRRRLVMTGKQLKNSILQWAIQGKLVPQDPNDEPASVLLEKIRAEKARLIKEGKMLRHCVGGYDWKVADGISTILFIRKREDTSSPFVTAEFSDGRVVQIRAYKNGAPDKATMTWFEEYKAKVLSKFMTKAGKTA